MTRAPKSGGRNDAAIPGGFRRGERILATSTTERSYRRLANGFETWRRTRIGLPELYVVRVRLLACFIERNINLTADSSVLEIGTGWVHWESLVTRLVCDARVTMFDVVDNRLFPVFKLYVQALRPLLATIGLPAGRIDKAHALLDAVEGATSFQQVYSALSWVYVIDPSEPWRASGRARSI